MSFTFTNYGENKLIDALLRGQAFGTPGTWYVGLAIGAPTDAGVAVEPAGEWYERQPVAASLVAWAGTQGAGSTAASSGTTGQSSNNAQIDYDDPTVSGDQISHWFLADDAEAGNIWMFGNITDNTGVNIVVTLNSGQPLFFPAGELRITAP